MDNNGHQVGGLYPTLVSGLCSILAWVSLKDAQLMVSLVASGVAIVSGCMAIIYYYRKIKNS